MKRFNWLEKMIRENGFSIGAELGVKSGRTTIHLLKAIKRLKIIAVDPWEEVNDPQPMPEDMGGGIKRYSGKDTAGNGWDAKHHNQNEAKFRNDVRPYADRVTICKAFSHDQTLLDSVPDGSLDFVFIDALHNYAGCSQDIALWEPKVREGGMMCGHDINWPGIEKAVGEVYPAYETAPDNCWWIIKPVAQLEMDLDSHE